MERFVNYLTKYSSYFLLKHLELSHCKVTTMKTFKHTWKFGEWMNPRKMNDFKKWFTEWFIKWLPITLQQSSRFCHTVLSASLHPLQFFCSSISEQMPFVLKLSFTPTGFKMYLLHIMHIKITFYKPQCYCQVWIIIGIRPGTYLNSTVHLKITFFFKLVLFKTGYPNKGHTLHFISLVPFNL